MIRYYFLEIASPTAAVIDSMLRIWEKGFPAFVAAHLAAEYPDANLSFVNRGISGNKIRDILNRIEEDCIDLKPDLLIFLDRYQ